MVEGRDHLVARHRRSPGSESARRSRSTPSTCSTCSTRRARRPSPRASSTPRPATCSAPRSPTRSVFDIKPDDVYWCAADIGWVHRPQLHRVRTAGQRDDRRPVRRRARTRPSWDRWWQIIEDYKVTVLYCAPTAIRAFMKQGEAFPASTTCRRCASSVRSASRSTPRPGSGTTARSAAAGLPIVDTWWQTETGRS